MTNWVTTIRHFTFTIWNDLILNRNGAGFKSNMRVLHEDVQSFRRQV